MRYAPPPPDRVRVQTCRRHTCLKAGVSFPNKYDSLLLVYPKVARSAAKCHCSISTGDDPRRCGSFKALPRNVQPLFYIRISHFPSNEISKRTTILHPHPHLSPSSPLPNSHLNACLADALNSSLVMSQRHRSLSLHLVKCQMMGALCW